MQDKYVNILYSHSRTENTSDLFSTRQEIVYVWLFVVLLYP